MSKRRGAPRGHSELAAVCSSFAMNERPCTFLPSLPSPTRVGRRGGSTSGVTSASSLASPRRSWSSNQRRGSGVLGKGK